MFDGDLETGYCSIFHARGLHVCGVFFAVLFTRPRELIKLRTDNHSAGAQGAVAVCAVPDLKGCSPRQRYRKKLRLSIGVVGFHTIIRLWDLGNATAALL
jgi:hypothetical protein